MGQALGTPGAQGKQERELGLYRLEGFELVFELAMLRRRPCPDGETDNPHRIELDRVSGYVCTSGAGFRIQQESKSTI
jgi:hypothetical protein